MNKKYTPSYFIKWIALIIGLSIIVGVVYHVRIYEPVVCAAEGISDYDPARDRQRIIDMFNADHYWLTVNTDYDIGHMLDTHSPNRFEPRYFGAMPIKVIREEGRVVAWCAYYMRTMYQGMILFMDVHAEARQKGYARKLAQFAECDLRRKGAHKVTLATRVANKAAQVAYERMNYTNMGISDGFVHYEKKLR